MRGLPHRYKTKRFARDERATSALISRMYGFAGRPLKPSPRPSPRGRGRRDWQFDHEPGSLATFRIFDPDVAVVRFDDSARDGQSHAGAGHPPIGDVAIAHGAEEFFE